MDLNKMLIVLAASILYVTSVFGINWQGKHWAPGCNFVGNDIKNVTSKSKHCADLCNATPKCSHFFWNTDAGGTCFMKEGKVSRSDAVKYNSYTAICGFVFEKIAELESEESTSLHEIEWTEDNWAFWCAFVGNDLDNVSSDAEDCRELCINYLQCTNFVWTLNAGGTCYFKEGILTRSDAIRSSKAICGFIAAKMEGEEKSCSQYEWKCEYGGQCIPYIERCDGKYNCNDFSDETATECTDNRCPHNAFQCTYGGCIDGTSKCDGTIDCADKSDESDALCGNAMEIHSPEVLEGACLIPESLPNNLRVYYEADANNEIRIGSYAVKFSGVIYKCEIEYVLEGHKTNFCDNGQWLYKHPICRKYCSPRSLSGISIKSTCEIFGVTISCNQLHRPNTIARITCALGYRKPFDRTGIDVLRCNDNGEWNRNALICEPICGVEAPASVSYIVGGGKVNITKVPWHVGIYSNIRNEKMFEQICGGTIISAKLVISAAHCFWDSAEDQLYEAQNFKVAVGKYFRDFDAMEPIKSQKLIVSRIIVKQEYSDYSGYYALDIALLTLVSHIDFSSYIKPICLEANLNFNEKTVQPGLIGKVAGWGLETSGGISSPELKIIDLPAIEFNECKQKLSIELQTFLTGDKFCAGYTTGQSVCQGDSGGGLVFPKVIRGSRVYFLSGIVSTGGNWNGSCDNDQYTFFTNVQYHIDFIENYF